MTGGIQLEFSVDGVASDVAIQSLKTTIIPAVK